MLLLPPGNALQSATIRVTNIIVNDLYFRLYVFSIFWHHRVPPKTHRVAQEDEGAQELRELIGEGKEVVLSEIPTNRAVLQYFILV